MPSRDNRKKPSKLPVVYFCPVILGILICAGLSQLCFLSATFCSVDTLHEPHISPSTLDVSVLPQVTQCNEDFLPFLAREPNTTYLPRLLPRLILLFLRFSRFFLEDSSDKIDQLMVIPLPPLNFPLLLEKISCNHGIPVYPYHFGLLPELDSARISLHCSFSLGFFPA